MSVTLNSAIPAIAPLEALAAANVVHVQTFVAELLHNAFPHLTQLQLKVTVEGLFNLDQDLTGFREHLRDFLVQIKVCFFYTCLKNNNNKLISNKIGIHWRRQ